MPQSWILSYIVLLKSTVAVYAEFQSHTERLNEIKLICNVLKILLLREYRIFYLTANVLFFQILWQNQVFGYFHRQTDSCNVLKLNVYHLQTSENFVTANFWLLHSLFVLYMAIDFNIKQACFTVRPMTFGQPHLSPDLGLLSPNFGRFSSTRCWTLFQDAILCNVKEN